jgi:hypothetical protein
MPNKRGRPVSAESTDGVAQRDRVFERDRKRRYRLQQLQRNAEQAIMNNEHLSSIEEASIEDQDAATTLVQLGLRVRGLVLPQDPARTTTLQQAVNSEAINELQPTGPGESRRPTGPGEPRRPTGPGEPRRPTGPGEPRRPTGPGEPRRPTGPGEPRRPTGPGEPRRLVQPSESPRPIQLRQSLSQAPLGLYQRRPSQLPSNQATVRQFFQPQLPNNPFRLQPQASSIGIGEPGPSGSSPNRSLQPLATYLGAEEEANIARAIALSIQDQEQPEQEQNSEEYLFNNNNGYDNHDSYSDYQDSTSNVSDVQQPQEPAVPILDVQQPLPITSIFRAQPQQPATVNQLLGQPELLIQPNEPVVLNQLSPPPQPPVSDESESDQSSEEEVTGLFSIYLFSLLILYKRLMLQPTLLISSFSSSVGISMAVLLKSTLQLSTGIISILNMLRTILA